ncbi:MAG: hypothetical protein JWL87_141 [Candidatus Adlerbacteria bacterium]|nr:hypothetical protein [Candidatus Adlerbacteria bacterium]
MDDLILYIHIAGLALAALGMLYADSQALAWLRGKKDVLLHQHILRAHHVVSVALSLIILTGLILFWPMRDYLLGQPLFWMKMAFVGALVINAFVIEKLMHLPTRGSFASLTKKQKIPLMLSGAVSAASWVGAAILALVLFW